MVPRAFPRASPRRVSNSPHAFRDILLSGVENLALAKDDICGCLADFASRVRVHHCFFRVVFDAMKRSRYEDPLTKSVNYVVQRLSDWVNACDGSFTIETAITSGSDFVLLEVGNIDEVRVSDLTSVLRDATHVVSCVCDYANQCIRFRFESTNTLKRTKVTISDDSDAISNEIKTLQRRITDETNDDLRRLARHIVVVKNANSILRQSVLHFDYTGSPGIMTLTVKNITHVDASLLQALCDIGGNGVESDIILFLSPADMQCMRIRIHKTKRTVNV